MKKIILVILILFVTGCDINYNLTVDDVYQEDVRAVNDVMYKDTDYYSEMIYMLSKGIPLYKKSVFNSDNYEAELIDQTDAFGVDLKGSFKNNNKGSNLVSYAVSNYDVLKKDGVVNLRASGFKIFNLIDAIDVITVNIKCNKKVLNNNADIIDGDTYTWIIDSGNYDNKSIELSYSNKKMINVSNITSPIVRFTIFLLSFVILFLIIYLFIKNKYKRKNSI